MSSLPEPRKAAGTVSGRAIMLRCVGYPVAVTVTRVVETGRSPTPVAVIVVVPGALVVVKLAIAKALPMGIVTDGWTFPTLSREDVNNTCVPFRAIVGWPAESTSDTITPG